MISNDAELKATLDRIDTFRRQVTELRHKETNPDNYRRAASSFLAEIDRMNLEVREYLSHWIRGSPLRRSVDPKVATNNGKIERKPRELPLSQRQPRVMIWKSSDVSARKAGFSTSLLQRGSIVPVTNMSLPLSATMRP